MLVSEHTHCPTPRVWCLFLHLYLVGQKMCRYYESWLIPTSHGLINLCNSRHRWRVTCITDIAFCYSIIIAAHNAWGQTGQDIQTNCTCSIFVYVYQIWAMNVSREISNTKWYLGNSRRQVPWVVIRVPKTVVTIIWISVIRIRRSWDCLILIMGIPILVRRHLPW